MVALDLATRHPDCVASLVLPAPQFHPPAWLMRVQRLVMGLVPASVLTRSGVPKEQMLQVSGSIKSLNLDDQLADLTAPASELCGAQGRANSAATRKIAAAFPVRTSLSWKVLPHRWHNNHPELCARHIERHWVWR